MKVLTIVVTALMLGSCINNRVMMDKFPKAQAEEIKPNKPSEECTKMLFKLDELTKLVQAKETKEYIPPPPLLSKIYIMPEFKKRPTFPEIIIRPEDDTPEHLTNIEILIQHIERLNQYIEEEQTNLQKSYKDYRRLVE